jgi:parallel beta-helix repeat protein
MTNNTLGNRRRLRFETLEERRLFATYVVSNTADSGAGSLRQAILDSNASPARDTIAFAISSLSKSIEAKSSLPPIANPVIIDATTQPGYAGTPVVELSGKQLSNGENGLILNAGQSEVRGLVINQFPGFGIHIEGSGQNRVESNFVGTDLSGQLSKGNGLSGIHVLNSNSNRIGGPGVGNLISGNGWEGVRVWGSLTHSNWIQGNRIGTDANGLSAVPNLLAGLVLAGSSGNSIVGADGTDADDTRKGNLISGNGLEGIHIYGSNRNMVAGNWVGLDRTGNAALANKECGILVQFGATENRIGSNADGMNDVRERNVIGGNLKEGIRVYSGSDSQIAGNWIGIGVDGFEKSQTETRVS